jgi:hypothetical protein
MDNYKDNNIKKEDCENCEVKPKKAASELKKRILLITGFLACPCHLPITILLFVALFSGTLIATWLTNNQLLVYIISTIYFLIVVSYFVYISIRKTI